MHRSQLLKLRHKGSLSFITYDPDLVSTAPEAAKKELLRMCSTCFCQQILSEGMGVQITSEFLTTDPFPTPQLLLLTSAFIQLLSCPAGSLHKSKDDGSWMAVTLSAASQCSVFYVNWLLRCTCRKLCCALIISMHFVCLYKCTRCPLFPGLKYSNSVISIRHLCSQANSILSYQVFNFC